MFKVNDVFLSHYEGLLTIVGERIGFYRVKFNSNITTEIIKSVFEQNVEEGHYIRVSKDHYGHEIDIRTINGKEFQYCRSCWVKI